MSACVIRKKDYSFGAVVVEDKKRGIHIRERDKKENDD